MVGVLPFVLVGVVAVAVLWFQAHRRELLREALFRLAERDGLRPTELPCGLDRSQLAGRFDATPRGARRFGLRYGVEGPTEVELAGTPTPVTVACFEWWYEERVQSNKHTSYRERTATVAVARLPVTVPGRIAVRPEGVLGRVGLTRGDQQVESEEFNRRFHVRGSDPTLTLRFLEAAMQHRLLTTATGRSVHLEFDLVVLGGSPSHRDGSLPGVIGELPAAAQDLLGLLRAVPAQLWRTATSPPGGHGR